MLIDSIVKKLHIAQPTADEVGLTNVSTHHTRAKNCDLCCDYVISRMAIPLELLHKYAQHMLHGSMAPRTGIYCLRDGDPSEKIVQTGVIAQLTAISALADYPDYYQDEQIVHVARQDKRIN